MRDSGSNTMPAHEAMNTVRRTLIGLGVFSFFINLLMLTGPLYMLQVYDRVLASGSVPTLVSLTLLILVMYGTLAVLDWIRQSLFAIVGARFEDQLADDTMSVTLQNNLNDPGRPSQEPLQDLRTIRRFLASPSLGSLFDLPWSPMFFLALFILHLIFGLWAVFGCAVLVGLALLNRATTQEALKATEKLDRATQIHANEISRNVEVLEAMGMRSGLTARWRDKLDQADGIQRRASTTMSGFSASTKSSRLFMQSAILGLGAWLTIIGQSTAGAMIAASIIMGRAIAPIEQIIGQWQNVSNARRAWTSLNNFLSELAPAPAPMLLPEIQGRISLSNVSAGPPGADKPVLKQVSLDISPGDVVGVIGPSAGGKTTLAKVVIGVWPARIGEVRIDGADVRALPRDVLGPQIGYLPQQVDLLAGTVQENIARFSDNADSNAVIAAAKEASCHELILGLPNGYDSEIGAGGAYLSAGQRQRIGLARALFGNPKLVVLDEPNSNLDGPGDEALNMAIANLKKRGATTLIIAHRPNAIVHCNKVVVLDKGQVKAFGPRDEILASLPQSWDQKNTITPIRQGGSVAEQGS